MGSQFSQMFPPEAKLTEKNLPDQTGKVHLYLSPQFPTELLTSLGLHCHRFLFWRWQRASPDPLLP